MVTFSHLNRLEAETIHVFREVVATCKKPVMLYSVGKDSSVLMHIAFKAFYPAKPPFPFLHVDTTWKFREMIDFRDKTANQFGLDLIIHKNPDGLRDGVNPFDHGASHHTYVWKTAGLRQALDQYGFDTAFGGARRDEEKSRAKERIFSFRNRDHSWDPKNQRPEMWKTYNTRVNQGESMRVFPISNWTESDIWQYIKRENIPFVPLYLASPRLVVETDGGLILADDDRMPCAMRSNATTKMVRFRSLGCYPLTAAIESNAQDLDSILKEMSETRLSERQGRLIEKGGADSMEAKKREGYF